MSELRYYLSLFIRRLPIFLLVSAVVAAVSVTVAVSLPPEYVSKTRLIVETSQIPDELAPSTVRMPGLERLQIIQNRLLTRPNLIDIANRLEVFKDQRNMSADEIVRAMQARTNISTSAGRDRATVMEISFEARTGRLAAAVLNEYLQLIQQDDLTIRRGRAGDTQDFFEREVDRLQSELQQQSTAILEFKNANSEALPERLAFNQAQRASLLDRKDEADRQIFQLREQRQQLIEIFNRAIETGGEGMPQTPSQTKLQAAQAELQDALLIYSETNPRVRVLKSKVEQLEKAVADEGVSATTPGTEDDPDAETGNPTLNLRLAEITTRIRSIQSQNETLDTKIADLTEIIDETPANAIALEALERGYENTQTQYNTAVARLAQAATGERIEVLSRGERISIIEQPAVPTEPTKPNRVKIAGAGTILGIAMGLGLVALIEFLNRAPRRPEDIIKKLGVWPMASIPYTRTRRELVLQRGRKLFLILLILVGGPVTVWAVHTYYLPLDLLADKAMNKLGVRW